MATTMQVIQALYQDISVHERGLIENGHLTYDRHNAQVVIFRAPAKQMGRCEAKDARYWYRGMTLEQYKYLRKHDKIFQGQSYGGIATNFKYTKKYMSNKSTHTHMVEFDVIPPVRLYDEFLKLTPLAYPKAEGDGGTFGLGLTGHYAGDAGKKFNELLTKSHITWKIVYMVLPNPLGEGP